MSDSGRSRRTGKPAPLLRFRTHIVAHIDTREVAFEYLIKRIHQAIEYEFVSMAEDIVGSPTSVEEVEVTDGSVIVTFGIIIGAGATAIAKYEEFYGSLEKIADVLQELVEFSLRRIRELSSAQMVMSLTPIRPANWPSKESASSEPLPIDAPAGAAIDQRPIVIVAALTMLLSIGIAGASYWHTEAVTDDMSAKIDSMQLTINRVESDLRVATGKLEFAATLLGAKQRGEPANSISSSNSH